MLGKGNFLLCIPLLHLQHPVISRGSVQTPWNGSQGGNSLGWVLKGGVWRGWDPPKVPPWVFFQAPTERQLRYKEKVAELRKKRNSGLSKEQKEKYMVKTRDFILSLSSKDGICLLWSSCSIPSWKKNLQDPTAQQPKFLSFAFPGAQTNLWQHQGAPPGEPDQRVRPGALQEGSGPCL